MNLETSNIISQKIKCRNNMQITLEEDVNVSDVRPDMKRIIKTSGDVQIASITTDTDKIQIYGQLNFHILYLTEDDFKPVHEVNGSIPINENMNMEGISSHEDVTCNFTLEDCQAKLINSRKFSVRALISFFCCSEEKEEYYVATDISFPDRTDESIPTYHKRFDEFSYTELAETKKDVLHIKDEYTLPSGKPTIGTLLYYEITPQNFQTKLASEGLRFVGDLQLFAIYIPEEEDRNLEYISAEIPFDSIVPIENISTDNIPDVDILSVAKNVEPKSDTDGENRSLDIALDFDFLLKIYMEDNLTFLKDCYSTASNIELITNNIVCRKLLMKNQSSIRISDQINLDEKDPDIVEICSYTGAIKIDEQNIVEDGIEIDGIVELDILYLTNDSEAPLASAHEILPFTHTIEIKDIKPDDDYELSPFINQINLIMLDEKEIEVKVNMNICALVFTHIEKTVISDFHEIPLDLNKLQEMPGLVGFIASKDLNLWDVAKKYNTTVESIMSLNGLDSENVKMGCKLLLLKQVDGL